LPSAKKAKKPCWFQLKKLMKLLFQFKPPMTSHRWWFFTKN